MRKFSYGELLTDSGVLIDFTKGLGVKVAETGWLRKAVNLIEDLDTRIKSGTADEVLQNPTDSWKYFIAVVQLSELVNSMAFLRSIGPLIAGEKIRKMIKGPLIPSNETTSSNDARNTLFEVTTAADIFNRGGDVAISRNSEDVRLKGKRNTYLIECKRPFSKDSLEKNINKAESQLGPRLASSSADTLGIIALSVSRILTVGGQNYLNAKDEQAVGLELYSSLSSLMKQYDRMLIRIKNKKIGAVIFQVSCPVSVLADSIPTWARYMVIKELNTDYFQAINEDLVEVAQLNVGIR